MKFVAIDTSQEYLTVIAVNGDKKSFIYLNDCGFQHSVTLLNNLEKCLTEVGLRSDEVELFGVTVGPGSFTGIRIGVASAKGFCAVGGTKAVAVTSFETMAYSAKEGKYLTVIDAHHGNYYVCGFEDREIVIQPKFMTFDELTSIEGFKLISGKEIPVLKTEVVDTSKGLYNAVIAKYNQTIDADLIVPFYLRLSQAEEGRP